MTESKSAARRLQQEKELAWLMEKARELDAQWRNAGKLDGSGTVPFAVSFYLHVRGLGQRCHLCHGSRTWKGEECPCVRMAQLTERLSNLDDQ